MNHTDNIKYIKSLLFKTCSKSTQVMKHNITDNLNNKYKLRSPALHEVCLVNSIEKVKKLLSYDFFDIMNNKEDNYKLTLDNTYFDETVLVDKNERILPIRVRRANDVYDIESCKINILDINKNNYCGYILYELANTNFIH